MQPSRRKTDSPKVLFRRALTDVLTHQGLYQPAGSITEDMEWRRTFQKRLCFDISEKINTADKEVFVTSCCVPGNFERSHL